MNDDRDWYLGMGRAITRRDFINGAAVMVGGTLLGGATLSGSSAETEPHSQADYNPPKLIGLRGSHAGSFETAHSLRDGTFWNTAAPPIDTKEVYDLVVVGAGISGLSAAHFFQERVGKSARILILENHDDFGGHAKRNEFHLGGKLQLCNGGTFLIDSPTPYSSQADGLLKKLGIDPPRLDETTTDHKLYRSLGLKSAVFFNKEKFGSDKLLVGEPDGRRGSKSEKTRSWDDFLADAPLSEAVRRDIVRIEESKVDYMPGLSSAEKKARLAKISYRDFLLDVVKADPGVAAFYQTRTHGEWGVGIDAEPALDCWALGLPGFQGMHLDRGAAVEDVVTARVEYGRLDHSSSPIRLRLNSTVVAARNIGSPASAGEVEVTYAQGKQVSKVRAKGCELACWNVMIPYLCPELPEKQKQALHYLVKVPLVYCSVGIRNWIAFQKLGIQSVSAPGAYLESISLNAPK